MITCRSCRMVVRGDPERAGSRCPSCRRPLYERVETGRKAPPSMAGLGNCQVHPDKEAVGKCRRCQQLFCTICRTRWHDDLVCLACLNQILQDKEPTAAVLQVERRQTWFGLLLAVMGWVLFAISTTMVWSLRDGQGLTERNYIYFFFLLSFVPAVLSLGLTTIAVRNRGRRLTLATCTFVAASVQLGILFSLLFLNITHN